MSLLKSTSTTWKDFVRIGTYWMLVNVSAITSPNFPWAGILLSNWAIVSPTICDSTMSQPVKSAAYGLSVVFLIIGSFPPKPSMMDNGLAT